MSTLAELDEQLKEVDRELGMRRRLYPRWVAAKTLSQATADKQIKLMEAVRETVRVARQAALMTGISGKRIDE